MRVEVECYSGWRADERPIRFRLEGHMNFVEKILDQWYGPDHLSFKVRADDGGLFSPASVPDGEWELVSFREGSR